MSVHPADADEVSAHKDKTKKAWTEPDLERLAPGVQPRSGSAPAPPSEAPPALGGEEDSAEADRSKFKKRVSLTALLPQPSLSKTPVTSQSYKRSLSLKKAPSSNALLPVSPANSRKTPNSQSRDASPGGLFRVSKTGTQQNPDADFSSSVPAGHHVVVDPPDVSSAQSDRHTGSHVTEEDVSIESIAVGVDLADVNLIIIGNCAEAAQLLSRRRREGGRALLLWTNRRPRPRCIQEKANNVNLRSARLNMAKFVWNPPRADGRFASSTVQQMRRQHGCSATSMSRFGPDILDLRDVECYHVQVDKFGHECGIEVFDEFRGNLLWALSGAVVFCGPSFVDHGQVVCSSIGQVKSLDVSVVFQEAKPLVTTTSTTVATAFFQNFLFLIAYFLIMGYFEAVAASDAWPWWRLFWTFGISPSFGSLLYPRYWGMTLFGRRPPIWFCALSAAILTASTGSLFLPIRWTVGFWSEAVKMTTGSVFTVCSGGTVIYVIMSVCVHLLLHRFSNKGQMQLDWFRHSAWTCAHILTTLGTWIFLYGISLVYVWMEMFSPEMAAVFLAFSTSATEKCVSKILNFSYTTFIYTPRSSINGSRTICGDQRRYLTIPVAMTHAYCEAVRLVSLLSVTVRSPSWAWLPSVLLNVGVNLMERTQLMLSMAVLILPWWDWMCPGLSLVILHDVKLHTGYAQYVAVLALLVAEGISSGFSWTSVFNTHCIILIFCCILLEILEDVLVHVLPRSDYWRRRLSPYYEQQPLLHPKQLLLMDHQGSNYKAAPLALHGQRSLDLPEVFALMWPSSLFTYVLMTLLLGAGYIHGVCDMPIPKELRVVDALIWETPLRCT